MNLELDRTTVLLSIRPVYVDRILRGEKTVELRRRSLPLGVRQVIMWRTGKDGGLVGHWTIPSLFGVVTQAAEDWACALGVGIDRDALVAYAGGLREVLDGIAVGRLVAYPTTVSAAALHPSLTRPPQSWRYAPAGWRDVLPGGDA